MSEETAGHHKRDCFRMLFINFLEELTKHESILYLECILQPNCYLRSLFLFEQINPIISS